MKAHNGGKKMYDDDKTKEDVDTAFIKNAGSTITKVVLGIGLCVTFGIIFTNCGIDKDTVQECKSACSPQAMVNASMFSCQCSRISTISNDWVIPRNKSSSR